MTKEQKESLDKLNTVIQCIAKESGSELVKHLSMIQNLNDNSADYIFSGTLDCWASYDVSGAEVAVYKNDKRLQNLIRVRIEMALHDMINLLETNLELLKKVK